VSLAGYRYEICIKICLEVFERCRCVLFRVCRLEKGKVMLMCFLDVRIQSRVNSGRSWSRLLLGRRVEDKSSVVTG